MHNHISWWVELSIQPSDINAYRNLTQEMIEFARTEPGTLIYERYLDNDGVTIHVFERYIDSRAAVAHMRNFDALFADRFHGMIERKRFTVFGDPSAELRELLDRFSARYVALLGGFAA